MPVTDTFMKEIQVLFPWMSDALLGIYQGSWTEFDDPAVALQEVRQSAEYDAIFGGNYDAATGQVRMTESDYFASKAEFDASLISIGINPDLFADEWIEALEGEVSPLEMSSRIDSAYERIIDSAPAIRAYYTENFGIEMTDAAIVASVLKPSLGDQILNRQISMAEIGGEAAMRGFDIAGDMAGELFRAGLGRNEAMGLFGAASQQLPVLSVLANRHADPDDEFDLEEFTAASIYDDPFQRRRMRRLVAQEKSLFSQGTFGVRRNQAGGQVGLTER